MKDFEKINDNYFIIKKDDIDYLNNFINNLSYQYTIINFSANWCGPCKKFLNSYNELSNSNNNVLFLKINVNDCPNLSEHYKILNVPTFLFLNNQNIIDEKIIGIDKHRLEEKLLSLNKVHKNYDLGILDLKINQINEDITMLNDRLTKIEENIKK